MPFLLRPTEPTAPTTLDQCGVSVPAGCCSWSRSDLTGWTSIYSTKLLGSHTQSEILREQPQLGLWLAASDSQSYRHGQEHGLSVNEPAGKPVSSSSGKCTGLRRVASVVLSAWSWKTPRAITRPALRKAAGDPNALSLTDPVLWGSAGSG